MSRVARAINRFSAERRRRGWRAAFGLVWRRLRRAPGPVVDGPIDKPRARKPKGRDRRGKGPGAGGKRKGKPKRKRRLPTLQEWLDAYGSIEPPQAGTTRFSVICPVHDGPPRFLRKCVRSVLDQTYPHWELILVDDASSNRRTVEELERLAGLDDRIRIERLETNQGIAGATNAGTKLASGEYLVFLDQDDLLAPTALAWLSTCTPEADLIYTDEDKVEGRTHRAAFFKPAWSPRLLLGVNYVNHITCVRTSVFHAAGGLRSGFDGVQDHDLLLRLSEQPMTVAHLPNVLYHWRAWDGSVAGKPQDKVHIEARGIAVVDEAVKRRGWNARASIGNGAPFNYRVLFDPEPEPPLVKVVIPTRDRAGMLRRAVDGVLNRTDGIRTHLVIVDNGSRAPAALEYLAEVGKREDVTVHPVDDAFNFSHLCNEGVAAGPDTDLVLLLNNDIDIRHRRWLLQLSGWLRDPEVIGTGPMLLYPDGRVQHGGVRLNFGLFAGHYARTQPNRPRPSSLHDQAREVSCLTAACLLLRTADFHAVGGMNEDLAIDFQDVELCLRLAAETGGTFVYDPTYPLTHHESASRGHLGAGSPYTLARMRFLWGAQLDEPDPYYNPHLNRNYHKVTKAFIPKDADERLERLRPRFTPPA